jgi:hypothetical protein
MLDMLTTPTFRSYGKYTEKPPANADGLRRCCLAITDTPRLDLKEPPGANRQPPHRMECLRSRALCAKAIGLAMTCRLSSLSLPLRAHGTNFRKAVVFPPLRARGPRHISTSYVERQNLTLRMQQPCFSRLTNAFSKKLKNHEAAVALYAAHYNFCRVHETLRVTPSMQLGVTDHIWSIGELWTCACGCHERANVGSRYSYRG